MTRNITAHKENSKHIDQWLSALLLINNAGKQNNHATAEPTVEKQTRGLVKVRVKVMTEQIPLQTYLMYADIIILFRIFLP